MATTTQLALPARTASPLALWHLLSLDAPTVATLWTVFIAQSTGVHLPVAALISMALAVWILYAADRILDARRELHSGSPDDLEARHHFHHRHRHAFLAGIALAAAVLAALLPLLDRAALLLYLLEGALLVVWFGVLHATRSAHRLPKEIAVGLFFSAAVFIPTVARDSTLRPTLLPAAALFAALCALNCLFIYRWEHQSAHHDPLGRPAHWSTRLALRHLRAIANTTVILAIALFLTGPATARPIAAACALSATLLLVLDNGANQLSRVHLRAAADAALLTPLLLISLLHLA